MKPSITIRCSPKDLETVLRPLEKLNLSIIAYHSIQPSQQRKLDGIQSQVLVYVLEEEEEKINFHLKSYDRIFIIAPKGKDISILDDLEIATKTSLLRYVDDPTEAINIAVKEIDINTMMMRRCQEFITKSLKATLYHELNNPLAIAIGYTKTLKGKPKEDESTNKDHLTKIEDSLNRINIVIKEKIPLYLENCFSVKRIKKDFDFFD